ncbi:hypothetical protein A3752_02180, partial [Oleiphilus sp. HI0081]
HLLANLELFIACLSFIVIGGLAYFRKLYLGKLSDEQSRYSALESDKALLLERLEAQGEQCLNLHDELQSSRLQVVDLNRNNARLEAVIEERDRAMIQQREQFESQKKSLQSEFENLANRIFDEKGKRITKDNQLSIEGVLKPFREQITEFRHRVDGIQKENHESAGSLKKELEILRNLNAQMSQDAQNLTTALKGDKKTLGNWGEVQLERSLQVAGLVKDQHYRTQVHLKDDKGRAYFLDFLIDLPDNQHLIIDSKASLVAYESAISAETEAQRELAMNNYIQALRVHVKELSEKNYSRLKGINCPSFVLMFLPLEAAYIEGLKHSPELYEEAYRENIILVSHTTLLPILKTVSNIWRLQNSQNDALALSEKAGEIYNHVCVVAERLQKLGGSLLSSNNHYNNVLISLVGQQGLHGKVERFQEMSIEANKRMPQLEPLNKDVELERLDRVLLDGLPEGSK